MILISTLTGVTASLTAVAAGFLLGLICPVAGVHRLPVGAGTARAPRRRAAAGRLLAPPLFRLTPPSGLPPRFVPRRKARPALSQIPHQPRPPENRSGPDQMFRARNIWSIMLTFFGEV